MEKMTGKAVKWNLYNVFIIYLLMGILWGGKYIVGMKTLKYVR
jgi:uncharacterized membrane protein